MGMPMTMHSETPTIASLRPCAAASKRWSVVRSKEASISTDSRLTQSTVSSLKEKSTSLCVSRSESLRHAPLFRGTLTQAPKQDRDTATFDLFTCQHTLENSHFRNAEARDPEHDALEGHDLFRNNFSKMKKEEEK